jgi:hypothetical protein
MPQGQIVVLADSTNHGNLLAYAIAVSEKRESGVLDVALGVE